MADAQLVVVTGSAGGVGQAVCKALTRAGHVVFGYDRRHTPGISHTVVGDIADRDALARTLAGKDAVIHLAATPDEADFLEHLIEPNVRGLYNVCDAVRAAEVPRLVLASSVQVVGGHLRGDLIRVADGPRVLNHYALTKLWMEQMGEMYARLYDITVLAVRLGWLPRDPGHADELYASPVGTDVFLSHDDAGRFFTACVEAELDAGQFEVMFAASRALERTRLDPEPARRLIGYEAADQWPNGFSFD